MTSGAYKRRPCPGCGRKTLTPGSVMVSEYYSIDVQRCRTCKHSFAGDKVVQGPDRTVTEEMRENRRDALLREADQIEQLAHQRIATAKDMREAAGNLLQGRGPKP